MKKKAIWKNQIQIGKVKNWKYALEKKGFGKKVYQLKNKKDSNALAFESFFHWKALLFSSSEAYSFQRKILYF